MRYTHTLMLFLTLSSYPHAWNLKSCILTSCCSSSFFGSLTSSYDSHNPIVFFTLHLSPLYASLSVYLCRHRFPHRHILRSLCIFKDALWGTDSLKCISCQTWFGNICSNLNATELIFFIFVSLHVRHRSFEAQSSFDLAQINTQGLRHTLD